VQRDTHRRFPGILVPLREHFERGIALYKPEVLSRRSVYVWDPGVVCLIRSAHVLSFMGFAQQAESKGQMALASAQMTSLPLSLACVTACTAWIYQPRRDHRLTQKWSDAAIRLAADYGVPFWLAMGRVLHGWAIAEGGQFEEGIAEIHAGLSDWRATGAKTLTTYWPALIAEACEKSGRTEEGLSALAKALEAATNSGERWPEAELHRLWGSLLLLRNPSAESEAQHRFRTAIEVARQQAARLFELRASISLARLSRSRAVAARPARCSPKSTTGSPKALTRLISKRQRLFSMSSTENLNAARRTLLLDATRRLVRSFRYAALA
jgi:predicted ATPase